MKKLQELIKKANDLGYDVHADLFIHYLDRNENDIEKYADDAYVDNEVLDANKDLLEQIENLKNTHESYKEIETEHNKSLRDVKYLRTEITTSLYKDDEYIEAYEDLSLSNLVNDMNVELFKFDNTFKSGNNQ